MKKVHFIIDHVREISDDVPLLSRAEAKARELKHSKRDTLVFDVASQWEDVQRLKSGELTCLIVDEAQLFTPGQQELLTDIIKGLIKDKDIDVIITLDNGRLYPEKNYIYNTFKTQKKKGSKHGKTIYSSGRKSIKQ